jgi:hypothetical protein
MEVRKDSKRLVHREKDGTNIKYDIRKDLLMKVKKEAIKEQQVFVLEWKGEQNNNLSVLNGRLGAGWRVQSAVPMTVGGQGMLTACCVFCLVKE